MIIAEIEAKTEKPKEKEEVKQTTLYGDEVKAKASKILATYEGLSKA